MRYNNYVMFMQLMWACMHINGVGSEGSRRPFPPPAPTHTHTHTHTHTKYSRALYKYTVLILMRYNEATYMWMYNSIITQIIHTLEF